MNKNILYIDTTDYDKVTYKILVNGKFKNKSYKVDPHKSYETLAKLEEFLKESRNQIAEIRNIIVNKGPGSYTGTRMGVTHAQALGFALSIPVKFLDKEKYEKEIKKTTPI